MLMRSMRKPRGARVPLSRHQVGLHAGCRGHRVSIQLRRPVSGRDADAGQGYLADAWPRAQVLLEPQEGGFGLQGFHFGSVERGAERGARPVAAHSVTIPRSPLCTFPFLPPRPRSHPARRLAASPVQRNVRAVSQRAVGTGSALGAPPPQARPHVLGTRERSVLAKASPGVCPPVTAHRPLAAPRSLGGVDPAHASVWWHLRDMVLFGCWLPFLSLPLPPFLLSFIFLPRKT